MDAVTVPERKAREAERLRCAAEAVMDDLRRFVHGHGGRFYVFGSVASARLRHDSDMDILIDMPRELESAGWRAAEESGRRHGIRVDLLTTTYASTEFVERVKSTAIAIP